MDAPNNWKNLIEEATKYEAQILAKATNANQEAEANALKVIA
jgi:hypothetical protein